MERIRVMHNPEDIKQALFKMADIFIEAYRNKEYRKAKNCYDTALTVATFVGLNEEDMQELFGDREKGKSGRFAENVVNSVFYHTSVKGNENRATESHEDFLIRQGRTQTKYLYAKK